MPRAKDKTPRPKPIKKTWIVTRDLDERFATMAEAMEAAAKRAAEYDIDVSVAQVVKNGTSSNTIVWRDA